jgi:parallel beta-helix repeat protein
MKGNTRILFVIALMFALFGSTIVVPVEAYPRNNPHTIPSAYPYDTLLDAINFGNPAPADMIFINGGYTETLTSNLFISTNDLWIVGAPATVGGPPTIDLGGFYIVFTGQRQCMMGLNIVDTAGMPTPGIIIEMGSGCSIWNNSITGPGSGVSGAVGIEVASSGNAIANNTVSNWKTGIYLSGHMATDNFVRANTFGLCGTAALEIDGTAAYNVVCHNNLNYGSGGTVYFLDNNPHNPSSYPNYFDDTTGYWDMHNLVHHGYGPYFEGNYYQSPPGATYPVPGSGNNGYVDNYPLANPYLPIRADLDRDGRVSLSDLVVLANAYGCVFGTCLGPPYNRGWDPRCDLAFPWNIVSLNDLVMLALLYGHQDP